MNKDEIRREFFKLKNKGHSYAQCRKIIKARFDYEVTARTLQRWSYRLNYTEWNLRDSPTTPKTFHLKVTPSEKKKVLELRLKTGWGERKIANFMDLGHTTINKLLNEQKLITPNEKRKRRLKYIRWQRDHPNSLWQMDLSDQKIKGKYCFAVVDDFSRFSPGLLGLNATSTKIITKILNDLIKIHGKPREILTDNGSVFGSTSKHSQFDRWCNRNGIKHIRTAIHSPTTSGKIERFFQTLATELKFCQNDPEVFRMRYNHFRPHTSLSGKCPAEVYFAFENQF